MTDAILNGGGYRPHLQEHTGIVEEGIARRSRFQRFIDRRIEESLSSHAVQIKINSMVSDRLKAEVDAIVEKHLAKQKAELERALGRKQRPEIREILEAVCEITRCDYDGFTSPRRARHLAWPRQFAMWLVKEVRPDLSLPAIGRAFQRDHTTVLHAVRMMEARKDVLPVATWREDPRTAAIIATREKTAESGAGAP